MRSVFLALIIAAAALFVPFDAAQAASADALYTTGSRLFSDGDFDEAEKYFARALEIDKRHTSAMFMLGETISLDVRRLTEAEGWYKKAIETARKDNPTVPRALFSLGRLYILLGRHEEAQECFRKILSEHPDFYEMADVYNQMGVAAYRMDRYDRALSHFKAALRLDPRLMEATFNMKNVQTKLAILNTARYQQRMGNNEAAIEYYHGAIERYPNYVAAWYQLGLLYLGIGNYDLALKNLERAGALNHGYISDKEIPYRIAAAYEGRGAAGDLDAALMIYDSLGGYKDARLRAGELYAANGNFDQAVRLLSGLTGDETDRLIRAEADYQLGLLHNGRGDRQKATGFFLKALSTAPEVERYKNPPTGPIEIPEQEEEEQEEAELGDYY